MLPAFLHMIGNDQRMHTAILAVGKGDPASSQLPWVHALVRGPQGCLSAACSGISWSAIVQGAHWSARWHLCTADHVLVIVLVFGVHRCCSGVLGLGVLAHVAELGSDVHDDSDVANDRKVTACHAPSFLGPTNL